MAKKIFTDESLATLIDETISYVDDAVSSKANASHTHSISNVTNLQSSLDAKVPTSRTVNGKALSSDVTLSASDVGAATSGHTHSSYVNQNAFSNVKVGSTTVSADTTTDTLEIAAGTGISVSGDATNDKVTITNSGVRSISTGSSNGTISVNTNGTSTDVSVKGLGSAAYKATTDFDAAGTAQTKADTALASAKSYTDGKISDLLDGASDTTLDSIKELADAIKTNDSAIDALNTVAASKANASDLTSHTGNKSNPHGVTLSQLGVTATAAEINKMDGVTATTAEINILDGITATTAELNYVDGVTSNIQSQLDGKSDSGHTHNYAGSSSAGGAATSANKVNKSLTVKLNSGTTEGTNMFTFNGSAAKSVDITPSAIGAAASSHTHDDRYYTESEVDTKLSGKANTSHGNHVPATQTANNKTFLRNDNTWATVTPANIGAAASSHNHTVANITDLTATAAELNYCDGVTSNIQTQLDGKASSSHALSKGTDTTASKTLSFGGTFTAVTDTAVSNHKITDTTTTYTMPSDRLFTTLVPTGTAIPENADLNTVAYMKVGRYYCGSNATVKTLKNCPTTTYDNSGAGTAGTAFMMEVYSPLSTTIDNETTKTWIYRLRKLTAYTGEQYIQYCYVNGTANNWIYGTWEEILTKQDVTGGVSTVIDSNLTASRALVSNSSGKIAVSTVTSTELGYLDGVTSAIQTQLDGKADSSHNHSASNITSGTLGAARLPAATSSALGGVKVGSNITNSSGTISLTKDNVTSALGYTPPTSDTNTTYTFATGDSNGQIKVTPSGGTAQNVSVKGLGSAAYTASTAYLASGTKYAGASTAGGSATSAVKLDTATAGSATQPAYFTGGKPAACTYTLGKSVPSDAKFTDTTYSAATTSANGLMTSTDKSKLNYTNIAYATCDTAADTAAKVATISGNSNWTLTVGSIVCVKFTNTNSAASPTLNVNSTGAKSIWYNNAVYTSSSSYGGYAKRPALYMYDGTYWVFISWSYDSNSDTKMTQAYSTTSKSYPLLMSATAGVSSTSSRGATTAIVNNQLYANPSTGKLYASGIDVDTVSADEVIPRKITISDSNSDYDGGLSFDTNTSSNIYMTTANGAGYEVMRVNNDATTPILIVGDGFFVNGVGYTNICGGNSVNLRVAGNSTYGVQMVHNSSMRYFAPIDSSNVYLGISSNKWKSIHAATATIQTSDEREKNGIMSIEDYPVMFSRTGGGNVFEMLFSKLTPKTYYLNIEDDKPELHIGFVAQDVAAILEELGMSEEELGLLQHDYWTDEETGEEKDAYGLRYEEFIALNVYVTQKLIAEKDDMKRRLDRIEEALGISANE